MAFLRTGDAISVALVEWVLVPVGQDPTPDLQLLTRSEALAQAQLQDQHVQVRNTRTGEILDIGGSGNPSPA